MGLPTTVENAHLPTEGEVKLGREVAAEVEKRYKVVTSGPHHDRLQRIAAQVVRAMESPAFAADYRRRYQLPRSGDRSRRVPFEYRFRVLDEGQEVNAFSLAGGPIYVTRGLMERAVSDHELAAVLAHECAHVAYHHVEQLVRRQKKVNSKQIWALLATVIAGVAGGGAGLSAVGNVALGAQLLSIATLTGYGRELEREADQVGVRVLAATGFHPLGMYTFMQKLARDDTLRGNPDRGIFQSHPYSNERAAAILKEVDALGFPVDGGTRRRISGAFRVAAVAQERGGKSMAELRLNGNLLYTVAAGEGGLGPLERAQRIADQVEELFAQNLTFNDVRKSADGGAVLLRGIPVLRIGPEDAAASGGLAEAVDRTYREIIRALWKERLETQF